MTTSRLSQGGRSPQDKPASLLSTPEDVDGNVYNVKKIMMIWLMEIYQPDCHEHKRLQPLEVATLEEDLLCPTRKHYFSKNKK